MENVAPISKTAFLSIFEEVKEKNLANEKAKKEKAIAELADSKGWQALKQHIESRIKQLEEMGEMIAPEMSVEEVGFKYLISRAVIAHLKGIVNYVSAVKNYFEEGGENALR